MAINQIKLEASDFDKRAVDTMNKYTFDPSETNFIALLDVILSGLPEDRAADAENLRIVVSSYAEAGNIEQAAKMLVEIEQYFDQKIRETVGYGLILNIMMEMINGNKDDSKEG